MPPRKHIVSSRVALLLPCVALLLALWFALSTPAAHAAGTSAANSAAQSVTVGIQQPTTTVATDDALRVTVNVALAQPADYLEVRLRLRSESGDLVYQKTQVRNSAPSGLTVVTYEYDLSSLNLSPGRYPIEVRVLATGAAPTTATSRALLVDANADPLPVAVVIRYLQTPSVGLDGRFAVNPSSQVVLCDTLASIAEVVHERQLPVSLAIAPVTLEEFARAAAGYETTAGVTVAATESVPERYAAMLDALRSAAASGTVDVLDVPYALPDLAQSSTNVTVADLARQWARADAVFGSTLRSSTTSSTAYFGDATSPGAIETLAARGDGALLVSPDAVRSGDATVSSGCYALEGSNVRVLVADENLAESALSGPNAFYEAIFEQTGSNGAVLVIDIGAHSTYGAEDVSRVLDLVESASWLSLVDIDALGIESDLETVSLAPALTSTAPSGYWNDVAIARLAVLAYVSAAGSDDPNAAATLRAVLVSESGLLAGEDGGWTDAAFGLKAASDAETYVTSQFDLVHLNIMDITLSGRHGNVPVTIVNDTGKELKLTLVAESSEMSIGSTSTVVTVLPDENFVTIPVSLGNALSGDLHVSLKAGDLTITDTIVHIKASYIDRLATVGMVVIVLLALLFYIYRRGRPVPDVRPTSDAADHTATKE